MCRRDEKDDKALAAAYNLLRGVTGECGCAARAAGAEGGRSELNRHWFLRFLQ